MKRIFSAFVACMSLVGFSQAVVAADHAKERAAIESSIKSYTAAFNKRDAKALAAHWGPEAVYVNPLTGAQVEGREAIEKEFGSILEASKGTKLAVDVDSIRFISPTVAVEQGVARLVTKKEQPQETRYSAIHVKRDGKWLLDRVTEEDVPVVLSRYEQLKELEWLIGSWVDADGQDVVETNCQWTRNKNFIVRTFTVSIRDRIDLTGMQLIGWDPAAKQIRSWVFDSDGGFAEGKWARKDNRWFVTMSGTLPDGGQASSVNVITKVDDDQFKWEAVSRTANGNLLPNIDEVVVVRADSE